MFVRLPVHHSNVLIVSCADPITSAHVLHTWYTMWRLCVSPPLSSPAPPQPALVRAV